MPVKRSVILLHTQYRCIYTRRSSPCFSPLLAPLCSPFVSPFTYLAPSSCDRIRPPQSQVACKLTPFAPPFTQPTPSLQIPRTPTAQRLLRRPREYSGSCYPEQFQFAQIFEFEGYSSYNQKTQKRFFKLEQSNCLFLVVFRPLLKQRPFKSCRENNLIPNIRFLAFANTRNESVHILRIHGMHKNRLSRRIQNQIKFF